MMRKPIREGDRMQSLLNDALEESVQVGVKL